MPLDQDGVFILDEVPISETWAAMEALLATDKVRSIGVSNFNIRRLEELLSKSKITPAVNQIEAHPYLQQPQLLEYCKSKGILVEAYSPMGNNESNLPRAIDDPAILRLAQRNEMDVGQLLVSWAVQRGTVVLPKSVTESRIKSNFNVRRLSQGTFDAVSQFEKHHRYNFPARWGYDVFDEVPTAEAQRMARDFGPDNLSIFAQA